MLVDIQEPKMQDSAIKPYCKLVASMLNGVTSSITLTDSSGVLLSCDYLKIGMVAKTTSNEYLLVTPSSLYSASIVPGNASKGTGGLIVTGPTPIIYENRVNRFNTLILDGTGLAAAVTVFLEYGVQMPKSGLDGASEYSGV